MSITLRIDTLEREVARLEEENAHLREQLERRPQDPYHVDVEQQVADSGRRRG